MNKRQQWQTAKQQLTNTEHVTQKTNPGAQAPEVCEKTFSTYFVPQPVENTTYYERLTATDITGLTLILNTYV